MTQLVEPRLVSVEAAQSALSLGRSAIYQLIAKDELRSVKVGTRRLIPVQALDEFVARLEAEAGERPRDTRR